MSKQCHVFCGKSIFEKPEIRVIIDSYKFKNLGL